MWPGVGENFSRGQPPQDNSVSSGVVWVTGLFSLCLEFNFKHGTRCEHVSHIHYIVLGNAQPSLTSRNTKVAKTPAFHFITLSHPGLTGGDCCRPWPQTLDHPITAENFSWDFRFQQDQWRWRWFWSWHWPWIFKVKYSVSYIWRKKSARWHKKIKHIGWLLGIKYSLQIWSWPWPWPWFL